MTQRTQLYPPRQAWRRRLLITALILGLSAPSQADNLSEYYLDASGLSVSGGLHVDSLDAIQYQDPRVQNEFPSEGGIGLGDGPGTPADIGYNTVTVSGATNVSSSVTIESFLVGGSLTGIGFDNDEVGLSGLFWRQNGAFSVRNQMSLQNGLVLTDNATGISLSFNVADLTLTVMSGTDASWEASLENYNPAYGALVTVLNYGSGYPITLDTTNMASPTLSLGGVIVTGSNTTGGMNFVDGVSPVGMTITGGNETMALSNGFSIASNTTMVRMALGSGGLAFGNGTASGTGAVSVGNSTASGAYAFATGNLSTASGGNSTALGSGNASGADAIAIAANATASATSAAALGHGTSSTTWATVVVGHYNQTFSGNTTGWTATDPSFVVGTGNSTTRKSSFVMNKNGNTTVSGPAAIASPAYVSPTSSTQPQAMQVNGATTMNGVVTFSGNVFLSQPVGDIPMTGFGN